HRATLDRWVQELARQLAYARLEAGHRARREGLHDDGAQLGVARRIKEDQPLEGLAARSRRRAGAKRVVIVQRTLDALIVEDHPEIGPRVVEYGGAIPHPVIDRVGIAAHRFREEVHEGPRRHNTSAARS